MSDIVERIDAAIKRITTERRPPLSIPLHDSDVDVVLSDARDEIERLRKGLAQEQNASTKQFGQLQKQYDEIERLEGKVGELQHSLHKMEEIIGTPPWKVKALETEIERLRRLMLIVDEMVGEDIKAYCSEQTNREWQNVVRELEGGDE